MNKEFRIIYSGFESSQKLNKLIKMLENGFELDGVLVSYLNLNPKILGLLREIKKYNVMIMIDSGAHSILYYWLKKMGKSIEMGHEPSQKAKEIVEKELYDDYVAGYIQFVKQNQDIFDIYVELDIQNVVGIDKVYEWRDKWVSEGLQPMLVWHGEDENEIKKMLRYSRYIGLGGTGAGSDLEYRRRAGVLFRKYDEDVWLHWFAFTSFTEIGKYLSLGVVNSVDSTSWTSASRFGTFYVFQGGKLKFLHHKDNGLIIKKQIESMKAKIVRFGLDYEKIYNFEDFAECDFYNLVMSQMYADKLREMASSSEQITFNKVDDAINEIKVAYGIDFNIEELLKFLIDEKFKRYVFARKLEEQQGIIDKSVTQLEDSLAQLIEKYMKIKYPERFRTVRIREEKVNEEKEAYLWEEKLQRIEKIFARSVSEEEEEDEESKVPVVVEE